MTWHDCYRCRYDSVSLDACKSRDAGEPPFAPCERVLRGRGTQVAHKVLAAGSYAAQLAWWLQFFPPERFMVITATQLEDEPQRLQVRRLLLTCLRGARWRSAHLGFHAPNCKHSWVCA